MPDPRARRGVRHPVVSVLAISVAAVLAGARAYTVIAEWAGEQPAQVLAAFGVFGPVPSEATIRRVLSAIDPSVLAAAVGAFVWTRTTVAAGRRVIAIDGKSLRGAGGDGVMPHLVGVLDHATGTVLAQLATTAKSNEIPTVRTLLATLDLTGAVATIDAMHTQDDTARTILEGGGDYLMTVKANRPKLLALLKAMPWSKVRSYSATDTGRGRRITRTIKVLQAPTDLAGWADFPGTAQVAQIRRTRTSKTKTGGPKKTVEVVYVITSADHQAAPPPVLAGWVQHHWRIESLHWIRDVVFDEDRSQIRTGTGAETMATLRNTAISLLRLAGWTTIAAALRHHQHHPDKIITLLTR